MRSCTTRARAAVRRSPSARASSSAWAAVAAQTFKIPDLVEGIGEFDQHRRAVRPRSQRQRALQQPHRRRVVTKKRRAVRQREGWPTHAPQGLRWRPRLAELAPEQDGALEVVAEQLIGDRRRRGARVQPVAKRSCRSARSSFGIPS